MLGAFHSLPEAMPARPVDLSHVLPYETSYFDDRLKVDRNDLDISTFLGVNGDVPDELLVSLCGAPAGSDIQAYLDSRGQLTFSVTNPTWIRSENRVSVRRESDISLLELKTIDLVDHAITGFGAAMLWRIVRASDTLDITRIIAFAAGAGRQRPNRAGAGYSGTTHGHGSASTRPFPTSAAMKRRCSSISRGTRSVLPTDHSGRCVRSMQRDSGGISGA